MKQTDRYDTSDATRKVTQETASHYVGYDYMELEAERSEISFLLDSYENFGWMVDTHGYDAICCEAESLHGRAKPIQNQHVRVELKRDRKILNKTELTRLQRHFEACLQESKQLEQRKTSKATMVALIIAFLGTAFMAGSVFAVTANTPHIILCILFAIPGLIGWAVPYPIYRRIVAEDSVRMNQLIDQKYDEMHTICERGRKLVYGKERAE